MPPPFMPAALGAAFLGGIVSLRVLFVVAFALVGGSGVAPAAGLLGEGIVAAAAAALAGASGGLMIPLLRPWFKRLGPVGDYLTGIAVVWAYLVTLGLVAPVAFGERILEDGYLPFALIYGAVLGAFGAFMHRREQSKSRKKPR
jgi:hypothetical protein